MDQQIRHLSRRMTELRQDCQILEDENADLRDELRQRRALHLNAREAYEELETKNTQLVEKVRELEQELQRTRRVQDSDQIKEIRGEALRTIRERELEIDRLQNDNIRMQKKDEDIHKLQKEIIQYKSAINASKHVEGQVSDTTICDTMNGLFSAARNWALDVSRQDKLGGLQRDYCVSFEFCRLTPKDTELKPTEAFRDCLLALVPDFQICKPKQKMHTLLAVFSVALVHSAKRNHAFGFPSSEPIKSATVLLESINSKSRDTILLVSWLIFIPRDSRCD